MSDVRIELICPGCETRFFVSTAQQGKIAECPSCDGWVDVPEFVQPVATDQIDEAAAASTAREWEQQTRETTRQLEVGAAQLEQSQRALDYRDQQDKRFDAYLARMDEVISRWDKLAQRMDRVVKELERRTGV
jgi:Zn-finger nucleic acid-binding protein